MGSWQDFVAVTIEAIWQPFAAFASPGTVIYWPYLVSAGFLAFAVPAIFTLTRGGGYMRTIREQFSRRVWWAPSTRIDYLYYVVNAVLFPLIVAPAILTSFEVGEWLSNQLAALLGPRTEPAFDDASLRLAYTVIFFVAYDLGRFLAHWVQHQNPFLWQFHKVHHSAEALTPMTSFRVHPVDLFVMAIGGNFFGGLVTGTFLYLGAGSVNIYTFLGLHIGIGIYSLIGNLRHSHVWLDYGPLSYVFVSPAQHQIHHSTELRHRNKNCGFAFAFWDVLFGTLYVPKGRERFDMGLGDGTDGTWHAVHKLYWWPFAMAARVLTGRDPIAAGGQKPAPGPDGIVR